MRSLREALIIFLASRNIIILSQKYYHIVIEILSNFHFGERQYEKSLIIFLASSEKPEILGKFWENFGEIWGNFWGAPI